MRWEHWTPTGVEPRNYAAAAAAAATGVEFNREAATEGATTRHRPSGNYE